MAGNGTRKPLVATLIAAALAVLGALPARAVDSGTNPRASIVLFTPGPASRVAAGD